MPGNYVVVVLLWGRVCKVFCVVTILVVYKERKGTRKTYISHLAFSNLSVNFLKVFSHGMECGFLINGMVCDYVCSSQMNCRKLSKKTSNFRMRLT